MKKIIPVLIITFLSGCYAPAPQPQVEAHAVFLPAVIAAGNQPAPGLWCASCGSEACRQTCKAAGAVGAENRFAWCELEPERGVYDFSSVERWLEVNQGLGLRSAIGVYPKTTRDGGSIGGACTAASDGSPAWALGPEYHPLLASGYSLLNYFDPGIQQARAELPLAMLDWYQGLPDDLRQVVDHIEVGVARDGEMTPANSSYGDLYRYQCDAGGGYWIDGSGTCTGSYSAGQAAARWRDEVIRPTVAAWGRAWLGVEPVALNVVGQMVYPGMERAQACAGCDGRNVIDYARWQFDIGLRVSDLTPDSGNGQGRDTAGESYVNVPNILKLNSDGWLLGEHGTMYADGRQCCRSSVDMYWAALNALDKGMKDVNLLAGDIGQEGPGADEARALLSEHLGVRPTDAESAGIAFRDTGGTYYPDGDNGAPAGGPWPCCRANPNYEFGIVQSNPTTAQVVRTGLPAAQFWTHGTYPSARTTVAGNLALDVDDNWQASACVEAEIVYLNAGGDTFSLQWRTAEGWQTSTVAKTAWPLEWRVAQVPLTGAAFGSGDDMRLLADANGIDTFHRVIVRPTGCGPTPAVGMWFRDISF